MQLRSPVGLGTAPLSSRRDGPLWWGPQDDALSIATIEAALDAGTDWIDTAPFYGWGLAEELVGRALAGRNGSVTVLTKCGTQRSADGRAFEDASPARVRDGVRASLDRLRMDHVDVVQVHDPDRATPIEATWEALMQLVADGVIGGAGLSNHPVDLMERARAVGPVTVVQHQYSLLCRDAERDGVLAWCRAYRVSFLAWSPLASGLLAEGFNLAALERLNDRHADRARAGVRPGSATNACVSKDSANPLARLFMAAVLRDRMPKGTGCPDTADGKGGRDGRR